MKKAIFAFVLLAALTALLPGQEVVIQDATPFTYAYLECKGSYAQIPEKVNAFMEAFFQQGLMPEGNFFGMYLNSPAQVKEEELAWRLGFPVAAGAPVGAPLLKGECKAVKMAVLLYVGNYEKVSAAYGKVFAYIDAQGFKPAGPIMEKYLDMNPEAVKPEERKTEIHMPVEKK